jgi:hypothetical protein
MTMTETGRTYPKTLGGIFEQFWSVHDMEKRFVNAPDVSYVSSIFSEKADALNRMLREEAGISDARFQVRQGPQAFMYEIVLAARDNSEQFSFMFKNQGCPLG